MDERLDSLGAQMADIRRIVDLGASAKDIHGDLIQSRSLEAANHHPMHDLHFSLVYMCFIVYTSYLSLFDNDKGGKRCTN